MKRLLVMLLLAFACSPAFAAGSPGWALDRINQQILPLDNYVSPYLDTSGVTVYVVDTGINDNDEFKTGTTTRVRHGFSVQKNRSDGHMIFDDPSGHGTAVASIIGGNTYGVVKNVSLVDVRVLVGNSPTVIQEVIAGLEFVLNDPVPNWLKVVNMSEVFPDGKYPNNSDLDAEVIKLISNKITVVVGAGNGVKTQDLGTLVVTLSGAGACESGSPARLGQPSYDRNPSPLSTITVSATMLNSPYSQDERAVRPCTTAGCAEGWIASDGPCVDIFAPGDQVDALCTGNQVSTLCPGGKFNGTSAATPYVTGLVAHELVVNVNNPNPKTPAQIEDIVKRIATPGMVANANVPSDHNLLLWLPSADRPRPTAVSDINANGNANLILRNYATGNVAAWVLNGTAYQSTVNLPPIPDTNYQIAGTADFNGDGFPDILWHNPVTGASAIWLMQGSAWLSTVNLPWLPQNFHVRGAGDFDGDGHPDILVRNNSTGFNAVWLMNGTTFVQTINLQGLAGNDFQLSGAGDFDGDGKTDIVWRNHATGANAVWLMDGTTLLGIANLPNLPNTSYHIGAIADYDGDGKPDIVWRNRATGADAIWIMNGGTYSQIVNLPGLADPNWDMDPNWDLNHP